MIDIVKTLWGGRPTYIAVSEWGYGIDKVAADAIMKAQEHVPLSAKPSQMLLYSKECVWDDEEDDLVPLAFPPKWQNGVAPKLVGLTTTHTIWLRRPR
jgi:hypothetical protein